MPNGNPPWWNVFQWKSKRGDASDPFFALNVAIVRTGPCTFTCTTKIRRPATRSRSKTFRMANWFRVEAFYKCAGDNTGHVTFWQDGAQIRGAKCPDTLSERELRLEREQLLQQP